MIDSHTHLFLCDGPEAELVAAAARGRGGADAHRRAWTRRPTRRRSPPPSATRRSSPRSAATRTRRAGSTTRRRRKSPASAPTRRCGRSARPGSTTTATRRRPADQRRAFAAQIEIAVELGLPIVIHARDPEGGSDAVDEIFATLDARAAGHPVILHCFSAPARVADAAERGWYCSFAGNVTYPSAEELREAAAKVPERAAPGRDRRPLPRAAAAARQAQRAGQRRRDGRGRRRACAASPTSSWSARSRPTPRALFGW